MLVFDKDANLIVCSSDDDLKELGIDSAFDFFRSGKDIASLFIQKPGYISDHGDISWIDFIVNDVFEHNRVLCEKQGEQEAVTLQQNSIVTASDMQLIGLSFVASGQEQAPQETLQTPPHESTVQPEQPEEDKEDKEAAEQSDDDELMELLNLQEEDEDSKPQSSTQHGDEDTDTQQDDNDDELDLDFGDEEDEPAAAEQKAEQSDEQSSDEQSDEELMELLNLNEEQESREQPQSSSEESDTPQEAEESQESDDDSLYDLDLDFEDKSEEDSRPKQQEQTPPADQEDSEDAEDDLMDLGIDSEDMQISSEDKQEESSQSVPQYIDTKDDAQEVQLDSLADELGLEKEETANFIDDFANMVKAKEDLLYGDNASAEAASLKNIAENFRLHNITKTLQTIEDGENNAALLFSQIAKLQNQLREYVTQVEPPKPKEDTTEHEPSGALQWEDAKEVEVEFDPSIAADSLGLPNELISEFVDDFIEQAQENKPVFERAYDEQDIKTIQQTAHKLKGAASNLRIDEMASKLEQLQHNEDFDKVKDLLMEYWGMFLGLKKAL